MSLYKSKIVLLTCAVLGATVASASAQNSIANISASNNGETITFEANGYFTDGNQSRLNIFIDSDNDPGTGYDGWKIDGADYKIKDSKFYEYASGSWERVTTANVDINKQLDFISAEIPLSVLEDHANEIKFTVAVADSDWDNWEVYDEMVSHIIGDPPSCTDPTPPDAYLQRIPSGDGGPKNRDLEDFGDYVDNYFISDCFMNFVLHDRSVAKRIEFRQKDEWNISQNTENSMAGELKFDHPGSGVKEITFMQLLLNRSSDVPFVRLVWKESSDSLWAVVRSNVGSGATTWHHIGSRSDALFSASISVQDGELTIRVGDFEHNEDVPDYFMNEDGYYFKAGAYFSGPMSNPNSGEVKVQFKAVTMD